MEDLKKNGHFYEYKEDKKHWQKRLNDPYLQQATGEFKPIEAVFLIGKKVERYLIVEIGYSKTIHIPIKYREAIKTENCWWLRCEPMPEKVRLTQIKSD